MKTVLLTAAATFALAFAAHAGTVQPADAPGFNVSAAGCAGPASVIEHTAYATDDDADCCANASAGCAQALSTQDIFAPAPDGRT